MSKARFVNEYRYTEDVIEEGVGSWWKWKFKKYAGVKNEKKRMHVLHPEEPPMFHVEIEGEEITIRSKDACRSVSIDTVEGIAETKSLIVLFIQGLMTVTMRKDGFLEGTAEDYLSYLKKKQGGNNDLRGCKELA